MSEIGRRYWRTRLRRWPAASHTPTPGYTLLLPVPGDLPVFLELALVASAAQRAEHRVRTIVIPDRMTPAVGALVEQHRPGWAGPLEIALLPRPERWFLPALHNGSRNHGMQLYSGVSASRSSHIILHDADLFPTRTDLFERQYTLCEERSLACLGVSGVWDPWYAEHGLKLAATWDMCARVDWLRSYPPRDHIGHDGRLFAEAHTFDTTLLPQAVTAPTLVDHTDDPESFVHFNYVITCYRFFQQQGAAYCDDNFRLLFVAIVTHLLGVGQAHSNFPTVGQLAAGARSGSGPMLYPQGKDAAEQYRRFRQKLERLLTSDWVRSGSPAQVEAELADFDILYGYEREPR